MKPSVRLLVLVWSWTSFAATPPDLVNYQGVLRNASDAPLSGAYDMTFRFWSLAAGGNEILVDAHLASNAQAVVVSGGLFDAALGGGAIADGSGPGTYATLSEVFRDHSDLWLEIQVGAETLAPRVRVMAVPYAANAAGLGGKSSSQFLDTTATAQGKLGTLVGGQVSGTGANYGIEGYGAAGGGYFHDADSSGSAWLGYGDLGIQALGSFAGGYFGSTIGPGYARLGTGNTGISAFSSGAFSGQAGYFEHTTTLNYAMIANNSTGISAYGVGAGGYFQNTGGTGFATIGSPGRGVNADGTDVGGWFRDSDNSGYAFVGYGDVGIDAGGNQKGARFTDLNGSGYADLAIGDRGIEAYGNFAGGYFKDRDESGYAYVGYSDMGIYANGNGYGGAFADGNASGHGYVGFNDFGVVGYGNFAGGQFVDLDSSGLANVAYGDRGIWGKGTFAGGTFSHPDGVTYWADVAQISGGTAYKIRGTGTVSFVQNHPYDKTKLVVYAAPEGDEVAVYTRGSARLHDGEARVRLGETFAFVANPDVGLTAHLTAREEAVALSVAGVSTLELVVRGPAGSNAAFDYLVFGLRLGFEEHAPVQIKDRDAFLPPRATSSRFYAEHPELRRLNALERFKDARAALGESREVDLSLARALAASVDEGREAPVSRESTDVGPEREASPVDARVEQAPAAFVDAATWLPVGEPVEAGDVLALDPVRPGWLRLAASVADPQVIGVSSGASRPTAEGGLEAPLAEARYATVKADAGYGAIRPGDALVASPTPGHAMRAPDGVPTVVVGRTIEGIESGTGTVRVLLLLR